MDSSVDMKLLRQTKFPPEFSQKVDMQKVNKEVMKKWIASKISEILSGDDDVVIELCSNLLEQERFPNIKKIQIQLTGFLDKDAAGFCKELWALCLSAQSNPQGVPKELLEAKKLELIQEKIQKEKAAEAEQLRRAQEAASGQNLDHVRHRERGERRGPGSFRFERGGRPPRRSRSRSPYRRQRDRSPIPPPRRYSRSRSPPRRYHDRVNDTRMRDGDREVDTYIPSRHRGRLQRDRSLSSESSHSPIDRSSKRPRRDSRSSSPSNHRYPRSRSQHHGRYDSVSVSRSPTPRRRHRSRSRSPRRPRRKSSSVSVSPPRHTRGHHRPISGSRSPVARESEGRRHKRRRRSSSPLSSDYDSYRHKADQRKGRYRDSRRGRPERLRSLTPVRRNTSSLDTTVCSNRDKDSAAGTT